MSNNDDPPDTGIKWSWQFTLAVVLIVLFLVLAGLMFFGADTTETVWQRRVYVFGAVEAIVFTAVGWIFGKEVHRAEAQSAKAEASAAKEDAAKEREDAKQNADTAAEAARQLTAEQTKAKAAAAAVRNMSTGGDAPTAGRGGDIDMDDDGTTQAPKPVVDVKAFFDELYPG